MSNLEDINDKRCDVSIHTYTQITQPAQCIRSPSACQLNAILMAFRWWSDGGPILDVYWEDAF